MLCVLPARPAVIEDEDGDLAMPRGTPELETNGGRIDPSIAGAANALMWPYRLENMFVLGSFV